MVWDEVMLSGAEEALRHGTVGQDVGLTGRLWGTQAASASTELSVPDS